MTKFVDMYELAEDKRIELIGNTVMCKKHDADTNEPVKIPVMVDYEEGKKADRYIKKLQDRFPGIRIVGRHLGPVDNVETFYVSPPLQ